MSDFQLNLRLLNFLPPWQPTFAQMSQSLHHIRCGLERCKQLSTSTKSMLLDGCACDIPIEWAPVVSWLTQFRESTIWQLLKRPPKIIELCIELAKKILESSGVGPYLTFKCNIYGRAGMVCKLFCKEKSFPIKKAIVFKSQTEAWTEISSSGMIYIVTIFQFQFLVSIC